MKSILKKRRFVSLKERSIALATAAGVLKKAESLLMATGWVQDVKYFGPEVGNLAGQVGRESKASIRSAKRGE